MTFNISGTNRLLINREYSFNPSEKINRFSSHPLVGKTKQVSLNELCSRIANVSKKNSSECKSTNEESVLEFDDMELSEDYNRNGTAPALSDSESKTTIIDERDSEDLMVLSPNDSQEFFIEDSQEFIKDEIHTLENQLLELDEKIAIAILGRKSNT